MKMNSVLPGIGGSLFPLRYLADALIDESGDLLADVDLVRKTSELTALWNRAARSCGPTTGLRALFDLIAMPLFALLGFRASGAQFDRTDARVGLTTAHGSPVGLLIMPWASRPSTVWRNAASYAAMLGADWCFVLAPPYLSLIPARGHSFRRSVDFALPDVLERRSFATFLTLTRARTFESLPATELAPIARLVEAGSLFQDRVRSDLQTGVIEALSALGKVLSLAPRSLSADSHLAEALTLIYRVLFLLFAESRDLVPRNHPIYRGAYAVSVLCHDARGTDGAAGLWEALAAITRLSRTGCRTDDLIVRPFNGKLFARAAAPTLEAGRQRPGPAKLTTARDVAIRMVLLALSTRQTRAGREEICYGDLGVEQLGAVYERVLDIEPEEFKTRVVASPKPASRHSGRRKQSGTFYTPQDLTEFVVRRTLAPLVCGKSPEQILALRVVDPAMGSGAFLVAACRYLAGAYEQALVESGQCSDADIDESERANLKRLIAERCLAGVDSNPVAVQLARLSLWLATLAHGKPLGFLDHRLRTGDSLIGASPDDLRRVSDRLDSGGRTELPLFEDLELESSMRRMARPLLDLARRRDESVEDVRAKEALWRSLTSERSSIAPWRLAISLWCARWFWPEGSALSAAETRAAIDAIVRNDDVVRQTQLSRWVDIVHSLDSTCRFFHWPLEFADVFYDEEGRPKGQPGFDAVIGNPPWEMLRNDPDARRPPTRPVRNTKNRQLVRFIRRSGVYSCCDRGHMNLYQPFLERALSIARPGGRVGLVLPWGLAVDDGAMALRARLFDHSTTDTIVGLDNVNGLFPIHRGLRFLVVVTSPGGRTAEIRARFGVRSREEIAGLSAAREDEAGKPSTYPVRLSAGLIRLVGGSGRRVPDARDPDDLTFLAGLAERHPRLGDPDGWGARFSRELNLTEHRASFGPRGLPVIEGKHIRPFAAASQSVQFRIDRTLATRHLSSAPFDRARLAYRDVSGVGNRYSLIAAVLPPGVVTAHTVFCLRSERDIEEQHFLCGLFNSYVLNAVVRLLMGGHVTTSLVESLPVPVWTASADQRRIAALARKLSAESRPKADGPRPKGSHNSATAALQAAVARLYGLDAPTFERLLEGFPLVPVEDRTSALETFSHFR